MTSINSSRPVEDEQGTLSKRRRARKRAACANCRRKKVRCTGERPICALCARTTQTDDCLYDAPSDDEGLGDNRDPEILALLRDLSRKVSNIEDVLSKLSNAKVTNGSAVTDYRPVKRRKITTVTASASSLSSPSETGSLLTATAEDYHRILPLPTQRLLFEAANVYSQHCHNQPYCIFNMQAVLLHPERLPLYLQFALVASAARFSDLWMSDDEHVERGVQSITRYASASWRNISMPWSCHDDSVIFPCIQAIHLLAIIDHTSGRTSTAWLKLGMALRLAHLMKLHREVAGSTLLASAHQEERRRLFWSLFILDRIISCSKERSPAINEDECLTLIPCTEEEWNTGEFPVERPSLQDILNDSIPRNLSQNHLALMVLATATLGRICRYALRDDKTGVQAAPWSSNSHHSKLDAALLDLESCYIDRAPQTMLSTATQANEGVRHFLHSKLIFHLCYCLLCHPFLLHKRLIKLNKIAPPSFVQRVISVSQAHAAAITESATQLREQCAIMPSFYAYSQAVAWSVHALSISSSSSTSRAVDPQSQYESDSLKNLQHMAIHWPSAAHMCLHVNKVRESVLNIEVSDLTRIGIVTNEDDRESLWDVVDYGAISRDAVLEDGKDYLGSTNMFEFTNDLDPMLLELLSQEPNVGTDIWQSLYSMPVGG